MTNNFSGFGYFAEDWFKISRELLSRKPKWNFAAAPQGPYSKIVQIEVAGFFITVAKRALDANRLFERSSLTHEYMKAELWPHGLTPADLTAAQRGNAVKRINKAMSDDMAVLVFFDLFEESETKNAYRLTDLGVNYYERLKVGEATLVGNPADVVSDTGDKRNGTARRRHSKVSRVDPALATTG